MKKVATGGSEVSYTYNGKGQLTSIQSPGSSPTYNFVYDKWGNNTEVLVGYQTLVTNTYKSNNGLLTQQEYGNKFKVGHAYDSLDRETSRSYNGTTKFWWTYNADGNLARYSESSGRVLEYLYDDIGRLLQVSGADGSYVKTSYDKLDKSTDLHYKTGSQPRDVYFNYSDKDNLPLNVKFGPSSKYIVENTYDDLTRLKTKSYAIPGSSNKLSASYGYIDWTSTEKRTTGTVRGIDYTYVSGGLSTYDRWYEYDGVGNITSENVWTSDTTKPLRESYSYDSKNQLVRHDSVTQNCTITYSYDAGGNITAKNIYAYTTGSLDGKTANETINYTYGNDAWKDELTSYKGEAIEYDKIGNPTLYRGWGMTWQGRQLATAEKGGTALNYTYDSEGIRTSKTVGSTTTKYLLNGTQILAQTTNGITTSFFYDQQGNRVAMADSSNHFYYYIYNLQGDVIALADASTGKLVATYTYDAWGKCTVTNASGHTIGTQNPFRYRGYYYDTETGLYYLQSRYYDPEVGRFINADGQLNTGTIGYNMFVYCENNPVMRADPAGNWSIKNAIKKFFGWVSSSIKYEAEVKKYTHVTPTLYGYLAKGEIASVSAGKENGMAAYAGFSGSTGDKRVSGGAGNFGLTYTSNNLGATVSFGEDKSINYSLSYNGTACSFSQDASGGTFTIVQTVPGPDGVAQKGMFTEIRLNKAAEQAVVGGVALIVYYIPAIIPEIGNVVQHAISPLPFPLPGG